MGERMSLECGTNAASQLRAVHQFHRIHISLGQAKCVGAGTQIGDDERREKIPVQSRDDDILCQRNEGRQQLRAQRPHADPGSARQFEVLGNATVKA